MYMGGVKIPNESTKCVLFNNNNTYNNNNNKKGMKEWTKKCISYKKVKEWEHTIERSTRLLN